MDHHVFRFATRGQCIKGKQCYPLQFKTKYVLVFKTIQLIFLLCTALWWQIERGGGSFPSKLIKLHSHVCFTFYQKLSKINAHINDTFYLIQNKALPTCQHSTINFRYLSWYFGLFSVCQKSGPTLEILFCLVSQLLMTKY